MNSSIPTQYSKKLKACLNCSVIKNSQQFRRQGCTNCEFLHLKNNTDAMNDCLSDNFKGMIALLDPEKSWVGKWQRINEYEPGLYALTVEGMLPDEYINIVEQNGKTYYQRDSSFKL